MERLAYVAPPWGLECLEERAEKAGPPSGRINVWKELDIGIS